MVHLRAIVLDALSHTLVGWAMSAHQCVQLVLAAVEMASEGPEPGGVVALIPPLIPT